MKICRLEKGGLVANYFEDKTRLYQFNPAYPLINELEILLKKTYTLLPVHEKKDYYIIKKDPAVQALNQENQAQILLTFWQKLADVTQLSFHAKSKSKDANGWHGKGQGEVNVTKDGANMLTFSEKGTWLGRPGEMSFSNVFRWTLDRAAGVISLEHLRRGPAHPVFLLHLAPSSKYSLVSVDAHLCKDDTYFGQIHFDRYSLHLNWRVIGPKKNEELDYYYS